MRKAIKKVSLVALTLITAIVFILGISTYNKPVQTLAEVSGQVYGIDFPIAQIVVITKLAA